MLHPSQFKVNETWIAFRLNEEPLHAGNDGSFHVLGLMDAASCFILGFAPFSVDQDGPDTSDIKELLNNAKAQKDKWPQSLLLPEDWPLPSLVSEVERIGIDFVRVNLKQLAPFIRDAQAFFRTSMGG